MPITVAGLPASRKTPGIYLNVIMGGVPTSAGEVTQKILLLGNKITTAITGVSPTLSVAAGTQANASPIQCFSADEAATYFGRGSELHRMALRVFEQYPDANVWACSSAESGGSRASAVYTFATTATGAGTVRFKLGSKVIDVAVASADVVGVIAANCATAINNEPDLPFTGQTSAGALTLTAKCVGPRGNALVVDAFWVSSAGLETRITTSSTSSGVGTTCTLSGNGTLGSEYTMSGGTTQDDVTAALAAVAATTYHRIASAFRDSTNVDLITAQLSTMAGPTQQRRQQAVLCSPDTSGTATTLATGRNEKRLQIVWHYASPLPAEEVAAQVAAARLIGDVNAGGTLPGEASDPAANLDGLRLRSVVPQKYVADQPTATAIESALNNGLTPLAPNGARTTVVRSVTSRSLTAVGGTANYSVLDTSVPTVMDYVADDMQSFLGVRFAGFKLAADSSDGQPPRQPLVTTPAFVKSQILFRLKEHEESAIITNVDANKAQLAVVMSATPGRLDAEIPVDPIDGLHVFGGNVRQVA